MRNLISVAVILHVAFTAAGLKLKGKEVQFGDIIAFPPQCKLGLLEYQHYAVFVGDKYPGKGNIFEHSKKYWLPIPGCIFSTLQSSDSHYVFNFLDGYKGTTGREYKKGTEAEMMARINEKHGILSYRPFCNNCEHLATYVRYGERISLQFNMTAQNYCRIPDYENRQDMWKYVNELGSPANAASSSG